MVYVIVHKVMQVIFIINVFQGAGKSCKNLK
jgi:hypothetical protein